MRVLLNLLIMLSVLFTISFANDYEALSMLVNKFISADRTLRNLKWDLDEWNASQELKDRWYIPSVRLTNNSLSASYNEDKDKWTFDDDLNGAISLSLPRDINISFLPSFSWQWDDMNSTNTSYAFSISAPLFYSDTSDIQDELTGMRKMNDILSRENTVIISALQTIGNYLLDRESMKSARGLLENASDTLAQSNATYEKKLTNLRSLLQSRIAYLQQKMDYEEQKEDFEENEEDISEIATIGEIERGAKEIQRLSNIVDKTIEGIKDSYTYALQHRKDILIAKEQLKLLSSQLQDILMSYIPDISFKVEYINSTNVPTLPKSSWQFSVNANYLLFDAGNRIQQLHEIKKDIDMKKEDVEDMKKEIKDEIRRSQWAINKAKMEFEVTQLQLEIAQIDFEEAKNSFEKGIITNMDYKAKRLAFDSKMISLKRARNAILIAKIQFLSTIGFDISKLFEGGEKR